MDLFDYMAQARDDRERQRQRMIAFLGRYWLALVALISTVVGSILVATSFKATRTETSGHLWWKDKATTEVPLDTRLTYLFVGIFLIVLAVICVVLPIRRSIRRASQKKYLAILKGVEFLRIQQIADITNLSRSAVYRDIKGMIDSGVIDDFYIDYQAEKVVSKKYVPGNSHKTVAVCSGCGGRNELIVGITRACSFCGEPLILRTT